MENKLPKLSIDVHFDDAWWVDLKANGCTSPSNFLIPLLYSVLAQLPLNNEYYTLDKSRENRPLPVIKFTSTRILCFIAHCCIVLHQYCVLYKLKVCVNPELNKSIAATFLVAFAHIMFLSYFDNSHISSSFIIIIFLIAVCDQWS